MSPRYIGPYVVVKRYGPVNWGIEDQESIIVVQPNPSPPPYKTRSGRQSQKPEWLGSRAS